MSQCASYVDILDTTSWLWIALCHELLLNACKFLNASFDFVSDEIQKHIPGLYRHHTLFKCVSIQSTLGSADRNGPRKLAARLAWITINLRLVSFNISVNLRSTENLRAGTLASGTIAVQYDWWATEMAISFMGLVKWSLDLCVYILQELFRIYYAIKHKEQEGTPGKEKDRDWIQETGEFSCTHALFRRIYWPNPFKSSDTTAQRSWSF